MGKLIEKDELGNRMKQYERATNLYLTRRTPVIIRLDGIHFHTFTKGFKKPFDGIFWNTMKETTKYLCENIQNCVCGYCQSDEISLVLVDYRNLNTDVWFGNRVEKMVSASASMCATYFNEALRRNINEYSQKYKEFNFEEIGNFVDEMAYVQKIIKKIGTANFDARAKNYPREEVTNYLLWRQNDCGRNSVTSIAQTMFSDSELNEVSTKQRIEMINAKSDKKYEDYDAMYRMGTFVLKNDEGKFEYSNFKIMENREKLDNLFL